MTRFETTNGLKLGARFAGDNGATFHLTLNELNTLFLLDESTEVKSDNAWFGNVGELLDLWNNGNKCSDEQLARRFKKDLCESLHFGEETRVFLNEKGELQRGTKFTR